MGQFLELLRERGYKVFHDLIGAGFNVDHVIVGPAGVFTIETKTISKPVRGEARISFDGDTLLVDGPAPDRDPVVQAKAQAGWLRELLRDTDGKVFPVRPVVVYPGWYIEQKPGIKPEVWVLNPKALPAFLDHEAQTLTAEDIHLASYHVSRYVRAKEGET